MREKAESLRQQNKHLLDLETVRDRILRSLKVGKQSPEYKRTLASLDRFIDEVRSS